MIFETKKPIVAGFTSASTTNREQELEKLSIKLGFKNVYFANQVHSGYVLKYGQNSAGEDGDGLICGDRNVLLGIFTADCVPIILYSSTKVAIIHAGWKGFVHGIFSNMFENFDKEEISHLNAIVGPCICKKCYEVSTDVAKHFDRIESLKNRKFLLDLKAESVKNLVNKGINLDKIQVSDICTYCGEGSLPSYRKNKTDLRIVNFVGFQEKD